MILIDFNQTLISNLMSQINSNSNAELSEDLIRHMVLSSILSYKSRFSQKYGQLVFCADDRRYWRKEIFPYYKANRKKAREDSGFDWKLIFDTLNKIRDEIRDNFPYILIQCDGAEADDVIASLCKMTNQNNGMFDNPEPVLIISGDKDFLQLQKYPNVEQYSPIQKKFIKVDSPTKYLREHIIRGDSGDGIPNFLSADDVLVTKTSKQKSIMTKKLEEWLKADKPEDFCDDVMLRNFRRNEQLIDLSKIPEDVSNRIVEQFKKGPIGQRKQLFDYFVKNRLKNLMESISDF